jgi:leucyl/phenylalanyl-tRNA--protein transferase
MTVPPLCWLQADEPFPPVGHAWGEDSDAPGLLAAGASLETRRLHDAYVHGIFPWYSEGQPILWWSPDPRMVLQVADFRLHRSLRKTLQRFANDTSCEIRIDTAFEAVIRKCAYAPRGKQNGTWILPPMIDAYCALHTQGLAHSVETWIDGRLVAGLYCVAIGRAVFGESMFSERNDGSKIALAALVAWCKLNGVPQLDCQQNTAHLASLGAAPMERGKFLAAVAEAAKAHELDWHFSPDIWKQLLLIV